MTVIQISLSLESPTPPLVLGLLFDFSELEDSNTSGEIKLLKLLKGT